MTTTIFTTPILSDFFHLLAEFVSSLFGWRIEGELPDLPKFVVIGAPHTSNWDFVMFLGLAFYLRADPRFMGKAELFRGPFGGFFRWCGGYPVDRSKSQGLVEQMVQAFRESDQFILIVTPEGTRKKVEAWKSGFYHIAKGAGVPVVLGFIDGARKVYGLDKTFFLTDDMEADMKAIQGFYAGMVGVHAKSTSRL